MNNYKQPGNVIDFTAPAGGVVSGGGYQIGRIFVVSAVTAAAGETFAGQAVGVFSLTKNPAQALTEGALVYWDSAAARATTTVGTNLLIGCAAEAAASAATSGTVRLNGSAS